MTTPLTNTDPSRYLEAALDVGRFLDAHRIEADGDLAWRLCAEADSHGGRTLYHGSAGVILFLLELHRATGDQRYLDDAVAAGDGIVTWLEGRAGLSVAVATGWPGYAFVLGELAAATGEARYAATAGTCLDRLRSQATEVGSGIGWIEPMPFSDITGHHGDREIFDQSVGAAGAGLALLHAHRSGTHPSALDWAIQVGGRLLDVGEADPHGLRWVLMNDMPFPFTAPNFAHGGAGVGYFLAELHRATSEAKYLEAAIAAARYVESRASASGDGLLVCHTEEASPPMFYLGACHGPAGTGRLFSLLGEITGDRVWSKTADALTRGLLATGAPETRSDGLWANYGQCCGDAGIGDYATVMFRRTADPMYLSLAISCADHLLSMPAPDDHQRAWNQAEHRVRPRFLQTQTGYMQGAAGIGSFLVHLATTLSGSPVKVLLPDMPTVP